MKMGIESTLLLLLLSTSLLFAEFVVDALSYDHSASIECLANPERPQYGGGIIVNPELNHGLHGWTSFGDAQIEQRVSGDGNKFVVAHSRKQPFASSSQKVYLDKERLYTFSAWIQVSRGNVPVQAIFSTAEGFKPVGAVVADTGCWSMLKGGLTVDSSGPAELYFESNDTSVEIYVDSISLQPFTKEEWASHQQQSINKARKSKVRLQIVNAQGNPVADAKVEIVQKKPSFPFGVAINQNILNNVAYQNWFASRFTVTTFENEMKWYSIERTRGIEDYSVPDAMIRFTRQHGIQVRGHNIFWDDPEYQPSWVNSLSPAELQAAANNRINSVMTRYRGQVIAWDVVNENLHFNFFESKLGQNASDVYFQRAHQLDTQAVMFMNEYNTIEDERDAASSPAQYLQKLKEIQSFPGNNGPTGVGLEGHFKIVNIPYVRSALDTLASAGLPVWITELDVVAGPNQASYLEQIIREALAHPAVKGIVIWAAWSPQGCYTMCLTDNNFRNLATGDVVDKVLGELHHLEGLVASTDADGFFDVSLFHGHYEVKIASAEQDMINSSVVHTFKVTPDEDIYNQSAKLVRLSI